MADVGNRIAAVRQERGLSQVQLANRLGVSRQRLWNYERAGDLPPVTLAVQIAHELGVTVEDLAFERRMIPDTATDP